VDKGMRRQGIKATYYSSIHLFQIDSGRNYEDDERIFGAVLDFLAHAVSFIFGFDCSLLHLWFRLPHLGAGPRVKGTSWSKGKASGSIVYLHGCSSFWI
jgi:hypothetical protein